MPIYTENAINGLPSLKFAGNDWIRAAIPPVTSETLEIFTVCKRIAAVANTTSTSFYKAGSFNDASFTEGFILAFEGASSNTLNTFRLAAKSIATHPGNNAPYIFSTRFDGVNNTVYLNGIAQSAVASTGNFGFDNVLIGARLTTSSPSTMYNGYVAELIVFNRTLTTTERQSVINGVLRFSKRFLI
ncbi:MAG: hypothetical protein K0R25_1400 [Rickettsiaceae bacterium]|nr:hypothetical protein [Rickettsiaceae bacterium]